MYKFYFIAVVIEEPEFTEVIENVTVPAGRNVKLACSVKNLGSYKVSFNAQINCNLENNLIIKEEKEIPTYN